MNTCKPCDDSVDVSRAEPESEENRGIFHKHRGIFHRHRKEEKEEKEGKEEGNDQAKGDHGSKRKKVGAAIAGLGVTGKAVLKKVTGHRHGGEGGGEEGEGEGEEENEGGEVEEVDDGGDEENGGFIESVITFISDVFQEA